MRAVVYEEFGELPAVRIVPDPVPSDGSVIVRVEACGICRSDWHGWMGNDPDITLPHVPGHELAGEVVSVGSGVAKWKEGDRVTVPFVGGCGSCPQCRSGNQQVCDRQFQPGFTHWGGFAEFVELRYADENLVRLPEGLSPVAAASLGCRFMTAYRAVVHQGKLRENDWLAVFGCGGVGLSAVMIANAIGARIVAVDVEPSKLDLAASFGAEATVLSASGTDVPAGVRELTGGGAAVSIDAIGNPSAAADSVRSVRKRGKHIQVGLMEQDHREVPLPLNSIVANEIEILGSHGMQASVYPEMFALIEDRGIPIDRLVAGTINLDRAPGVLVSMDNEITEGITVIDNF